MWEIVKISKTAIPELCYMVAWNGDLSSQVIGSCQIGDTIGFMPVGFTLAGALEVQRELNNQIEIARKKLRSNAS